MIMGEAEDLTSRDARCTVGDFFLFHHMLLTRDRTL